jgi:hypothetical protein
LRTSAIADVSPSLIPLIIVISSFQNKIHYSTYFQPRFTSPSPLFILSISASALREIEEDMLIVFKETIDHQRFLKILFHSLENNKSYCIIIVVIIVIEVIVIIIIIVNNKHTPVVGISLFLPLNSF